MTTEERLERAAVVLDKVAQAWRNDWSDFDGRQLRDQLYGVTGFMRGSVESLDDLERWTENRYGDL